MEIVLKHLENVLRVKQVMDIQVVYVLNVKLELIHHLEVQKHVNHAVHHHGQMLEQEVAQNVLDVHPVFLQQEYVMVVIPVMDIQMENALFVQQDIIQQEFKWDAQNVIHSVKHVIQKQVNV